MAIVVVGWELHVTLVDSSGENTANKSYQLNADTYLEAGTAAGNVLTALAAMTAAAIKGYKISEVHAETGVFSLPLDAEVENQALLIYQLDGNPFKTASERVPAPEPAIFMAATGSGRNTVDTGNAAVIAYRSLYQNPPGNDAFISDGETVELLKKGRRTHRQSSKG